MPKWARMALAGAVGAVVIDYFISPTVSKTFKV
jgi:hypothetical protein